MPDSKPNILFIVADDIGWFNVTCYNFGIMDYRTPNIDRIAGKGRCSLPFTASYLTPCRSG
jgi:arylsulfatase